MTDIDSSEFKQRIHEIIAELKSYDAAASESRAAVQLDQTSVGRLSRIDAMQQQAMANATSQRRKADIKQAEAALKRIEEGEFGYCIECGEDIAPKRLDHNPSVATCITCASG